MTYILVVANRINGNVYTMAEESNSLQEMEELYDQTKNLVEQEKIPGFISLGLFHNLEGYKIKGIGEYQFH